MHLPIKALIMSVLDPMESRLMLDQVLILTSQDLWECLLVEFLHRREDPVVCLLTWADQVVLLLTRDAPEAPLPTRVTCLATHSEGSEWLK